MKVTLSLRLTHRREEDATRAVLILEHLPATEHRHQPGCGVETRGAVLPGVGGGHAAHRGLGGQAEVAELRPGQWGQ